MEKDFERWNKLKKTNTPRNILALQCCNFPTAANKATRSSSLI
jgi:hypothetical protein